jgi:outer membrane protein insertion porin family/translocation and assembly module TamA
MRADLPLRAAKLALCVSACACASVPQGRSAIDSVRIVGARSLDPGEIIGRLATTESPKFLGLFRGVASDYSIYDTSVLQRDLARVERYYRGRGFFEAHVRVARVVHVSSDHVRVEIVVDEGPPVLGGDVRIEGLTDIPPLTADAVRLALDKALPKGKRFDENAYQDAQSAALRALTDRGHAYARVYADAHVDLASHTVDYAFTVTPGMTAVYGPITFVGLDPDGAGPQPQEIDEAVLRRVMHMKEGRPYSTAEIDAATQALLDLEVFSAVHVVPGLSDPPTPRVPLVLQVEPTKLRAVRLGAGAEFDAIKTDVHTLLGWEDHDFLGGLRDFSVDLKPGLVLYPTSVTNIASPTDLLVEERLRLQLRQPGFLEARTNGFIQPELNVYPLLVEAKPSQAENVVGYVEPKLALGVERRLGKHLFAKVLYNLQGEVPVRYKGQLDPSLPEVLLSFPQLVAQLDFKDDPLHPHAGFAADIDFQVAGGPFGGTATDIRIQPDVEGYIPIVRGVTFALSGTLGLLFPSNYGDSVKALSPPGVANNRDIETVYFRGFFSGGPNSNRGYPLRGVAPHGYVPFLNPATASVQVANRCDPNDPLTRNDSRCSSPIGGFTQWEASAELRFAVSGPFGAALFCDAGDVSQFVLLLKERALRFDYLHMSCGLGGRYDTPVGPIRLDVGYRIPGLQILGQKDPSTYDPTFWTPPNLFDIGGFPGLPIAVAFGIGEAF